MREAAARHDFDHRRAERIQALAWSTGGASSSTSGSPKRAPTARSRSMTDPRSRSSTRRAPSSPAPATVTSTTRTPPAFPHAQAVNVRNRNYIVAARVDIPAPGASGVLFAQGSPLGGHALYVKDNRLHYVYSFVGMLEQR